MKNEKEYCTYLPDPFRTKEGECIQSPVEWEEQKAYFRELAQKYMYGRWPGTPESLNARITETKSEYDGKARREKIDLQVNGRFLIEAELIYPTGAECFPVIVVNTSPGPESCPIEEEVVLKAGYGIATFTRDGIRPDRMLEPEEKAEYPQLQCGTIMAWGWCQSIVAQYLKSRSDTGALIATGHSRSGKAALCAGIFDESFEVVAPMGSGCGGAGSARFLGTTDGKRQDEAHCETIGSLVNYFPYWFAESYGEYGTRQEPYPLGEQVNYFPLDAHILLASCAPRAVYVSEGEDDLWANAFGTQLSSECAQKVFDFLGVPERNGFHIRPGSHSFCEHDWAALVDFCDMVLGRERKMPHEDTVMKYFDIELKDYAPWAV